MSFESDPGDKPMVRVSDKCGAHQRPDRPRRPIVEVPENVDANLLAMLERAARASGLPLNQWELLARDGAAALQFVDAYETGHVAEFLAGVDWDELESD